MTPAEAIRNARLKAGLTVRELAEKMHCYPNQVYRWERGDATPSAATLRKIVDATGQPIRVDY